jgi:serine/threonine protein phosphatase PrpC
MVEAVNRQGAARPSAAVPVRRGEVPFEHALASRKSQGAVKDEVASMTDITALQTMGFGGGRYEDQQDRTFWGTSHIANAKAAKLALRRGINEIDKSTQHHVEGGSTLSAGILTKDKILTTAQVGDSPVMLFFVNKKTGKVIARDLTEDQSPDAEKERIEAAGGSVEHNRQANKNGTLALARSVGDHEFPGITAEPSIRSHNLERILANRNVEAFLVVCSDGMTDHNDIDDFAADIQPGDKPRDIARRFVDRALKSTDEAGVEEGDNVSVCVARLKGDAPAATYIGVADGHGENAAEVAAQVRAGIHHALHRDETDPGPARRQRPQHHRTGHGRQRVEETPPKMPRVRSYLGGSG